jgi:hypothetical protein
MTLSISDAVTFVTSHFFTIVAVLFVLDTLRVRFRPVLSSIPGPTLAAYTKLWRLHDVWKGDAHNTAIKLHRKHGNLVRIGPNHVSVGDPKEISNIYGLNKGYTKVRILQGSLNHR